MTWSNTKRAKRRAQNRRDWHQQRIDNAATGKQQLLAACAWLVSEAWQAGLITETFEYVMTKVHDIRDREVPTHDHDSYAA